MEFGACYPPVKGPHPTKPNGFYGAAPNVQYVKYVPVGYVDTHSKAVGYLLWLFGFTGAHRFYYGRPLTGILWFFTFGLLGVGWLVDLFLIPSMDSQTDKRFNAGQVDYNLSWILLLFFGVFGFHRFYQAKIVTGLIYLFTFGLFGIGYVYDILTLNDQVSERNYHQQLNWMA
ncbi:MAG: TM2 domain-containing protein [Mariniblastus sp.]